MSTAHIRYDLLVQDALKGVVRRVLTDTVRDGLPGDHHFYISFRTDKSGVRLSQRLRERYPQDMTIVLQHQFTGLNVTDQAFEVGLSFSGIPERLRIPFDALTGFFDPSVQFGLKFETQDVAQDGDADEPSPIPTLPGPVPKLGSRKTSKSEGKDEAAADADEAAPAAEESGAEVVSLDAFRKKS
ncbi:SspB family protein [Enterovirga rhinocerotis]|uniref:Stringent starvation protein B n=1 Tax=Enterovirga rhinocerotis TaxID=1339210 RepID=A0A4R7BR40_9HYPH|nr:ClpXP protease specificity-enhancing factor SspB [Enterovirga rhinocerotis]TDR88108.1 hypothetical protein EV668_3976 [Enterovirga rhinocerotis]